MATIRILMVDDSDTVLETFPRFFEFEDDMDIVGTVNNGFDSIKVAQDLKPTIILMNYVMPFMDGIQATEKILAKIPDVKVIIMSHYTRDGLLEEVLASGAKAFVKQPINDIDVFMTLIRDVVAGKDHLAQTL